MINLPTSLASSSTSDIFIPINLFTEKKVFSGFTTACLLAIFPTSLSPFLVYATTDGVILCPSALVTIVGFPPSMAATALLVIPKSIPTTFSHTTTLLFPFLLLLLLQLLHFVFGCWPKNKFLTLIDINLFTGLSICCGGEQLWFGSWWSCVPWDNLCHYTTQSFKSYCSETSKSTMSITSPAKKHQSGNKSDKNKYWCLNS